MRTGASPRARGRPGLRQHRGAAARNIPAGAGATCSGRRPRPSSPEHPRGRGGDPGMTDLAHPMIGASPRARGRRTAARYSVRYAGASPRARGRHGGREGFQGDRRSIPAGAGATRPRGCGTAGPAEHPRGCGGDYRLAEAALYENGASPRARGRRGPSRCLLDYGRSIPAGAGATTCGAS
ncbi:conserved hypothetical protein [Streptomyces sp. e14]|nr:conserved hypothetical protein [Streptomyces sp. e14]